MLVNTKSIGGLVFQDDLIYRHITKVVGQQESAVIGVSIWTVLRSSFSREPEMHQWTTLLSVLRYSVKWRTLC